MISDIGIMIGAYICVRMFQVMNVEKENGGKVYIQLIACVGFLVTVVCLFGIIKSSVDASRTLTPPALGIPGLP